MTDVRAVVHGDDFTFAAIEVELKKTRMNVRDWFDAKVRGTLGRARGDQLAIETLGWALRWTDEGPEYEVDEKHRQAFGRSEGGRTRSSVRLSGLRTSSPEEDDELMEAERDEVPEVGSDVSMDRSAGQYVAKETQLANPSKGHWTGLKKAGRYEGNVGDASLGRRRQAEHRRARSLGGER